MSHHEEEDDVAEARQRAKQSRKQIETGGRFKPGEGLHTIRILETPADKERHSPAIYIEYQVHRDIGPNKRFARCGNEPGGKTGNCWLCRKAEKLEREGKTKQAAKLAPQLMMAVQVAVLDKDLDEWVGPLIWEMSSGKSSDAIGYKIRGVICSDKRNYTNHKKGYDLDFKRTGTRLKTKWGDIDHADRPSKVSKEIVNKLKPFVDTDLSTYNEDWQKDAYYGRDNQKGDKMAKKKKDEDTSDSSASDSSSSDASSSDSSSSDASSSDASSSDSSSSDSSSSDSSDKKSKKKKKGKKDSSDSSSSDSSSSDASSSDASSSDSSSSDASSSDSSSSDASSSDASSSDSSSSDSSAKKTKRKPRSDKGKPRKTAKKKKGKK